MQDGRPGAKSVGSNFRRIDHSRSSAATASEGRPVPGVGSRAHRHVKRSLRVGLLLTLGADAGMFLLALGMTWLPQWATCDSSASRECSSPE